MVIKPSHRCSDRSPVYIQPYLISKRSLGYSALLDISTLKNIIYFLYLSLWDLFLCFSYLYLILSWECTIRFKMLA